MKTNKSQLEQQSETITNKMKFSIPNLFKCSFCTHINSKQEEEYLEVIYNSINEINLHLKRIERY